MHVFGTRQWIEVLNESHPDTPGGKVDYLVSETGRDIVRLEFPWEDTVVHNLEAFAAAIAGTAEYPFTPEQWSTISKCSKRSHARPRIGAPSGSPNWHDAIAPIVLFDDCTERHDGARR